MTSPKKGRPQGARNVRLEAEAPASRCPACGSTERGPYLDRQETAHDGIDPTGQPYTHIIRRRVRCSACDQLRIDRTHENRADEAAA